MKGIEMKIEVLGIQGEYCPAVLKNVEGDKAIVCYVNKFDSTDAVNLSKIRLSEKCASTSIDSLKDIKASTNLEVLIGATPTQLEAAFSSDQSSASSIQSASVAWWPCHVSNVKGDFVVVELVNAASSEQIRKTEIVERDQLRLASKQPLLTPEKLSSWKMKFPSELSSFASDLNLHSDIVKHCGPALFSYDQASATLTVLSPFPNVIRHVELIEDTHIKMLRQKYSLHQSVDHVAKKLNSTKLVGRNGRYTEQFNISPELMGLAIGTHGSNINTARDLPDIIAIHVDDDECTFTIIAKTQESAQKARSILEYTEEAIRVPHNMVSRMIGRSGTNVQQIVDKSGVVRVRIESSEDETGDVDETNYENTHASNDVAFLFVGTKESINNARILMDFQIEQMKELEQMQAERLEIVKELRTVERSTNPPSYHPRGAYSEHYNGHEGAPGGPPLTQGEESFRGGRGRNPKFGNNNLKQSNSFRERGDGRGGDRRGGFHSKGGYYDDYDNGGYTDYNNYGFQKFSKRNDDNRSGGYASRGGHNNYSQGYSDYQENYKPGKRGRGRNNNPTRERVREEKNQ